MAAQVRRLDQGDLVAYRAMNQLFAEAFEDAETYSSAPPEEAYVRKLLSNDSFIALVCEDGEQVIGAIAAYELPKFEQARSEVYIYDLGVTVSARRRGVATSLLAEIRRIATQRGAWVVYVQADYEDPPAIALYEKYGRREEVLHFDLDPLAPEVS